MRTINDFLVYAMVSSWSTHVKLTYPYCMENNKAFMLTSGGKMPFLFPPMVFLTDHKCRKDFFVGRVEKDVTPSLL